MVQQIIVSFFLFLLSFGKVLTAQSFLAAGKWAKLELKQPGMYAITKADLLSMGFDLSSADPRKFKLFGIQGKALGQTNAPEIRNQCPEIPIKIFGEEDGKWNDGDYVVFYGQGVKDWEFDGESYRHFVNFYASSTKFVMGYNAADTNNGKRVSYSAPVTGAISKIYSGNEERVFHDSDMINPIGMGRVWLGEKLGNETLQRSFSAQLSPSIDSVRIKFLIASSLIEDSGSLVVVCNGFSFRQKLRATAGGYENYYFVENNVTVPAYIGSVAIKFILNRPNTKSSVYIDYFEIEGKNKHSIVPGPTCFVRNTAMAQDTRNVEYEFIPSLPNCVLWNVSNPMRPEQVEILSNGNGLRSMLIGSQSPKSNFLCFNLGADNFLKPSFLGILNNQPPPSQGPYDFIILSHPSFIDAAKELQAFRSKNPGYKTLVVTPQEIYNEFSGGQQDLVALRDFFRWQKSYSDKVGSLSTRFRYVTLLGAASFDMQDRVSGNTNFIPVYQSGGTSLASAFCLDDFLAYLDSNSGDPELGSSKMGISIGRIPARTKQEAMAVVEKIKRYANPLSLGPWRSRITFSCDDVDESWETEFVKESEAYAQFINQKYPAFQVNRLYTDAFKQITTGNNETYPEMSSAINRTLKEGTLFFNYQGHGGVKGWAQESILDIPMINNWDNKYRMPVFFTATCEFSSFDNPAVQSGGELALLNPNGGAIALMSTTRLVYVSGNSQINSDFWTKYGFPKPNEPIPTVGELFQRMKNRPSINSEDNKFALLGDASMPLAFPKHLIYVDSVQGKSRAQFRDTIKAFSIVRLKGHVDERLIGKFTSFNGNMWVKVYDKPLIKYTLNNDNANNPVAFEEQGGMLFNGQVSVTKGEFELLFSIPKDIAYNYGIGIAKFYAHNGETDAAGSWQFYIGGSETLVNPDTKGPLVKAYMQDTTFLSGASVASGVDFVARIYDQDGINATGAGIGRNILLVIDEGSEVEETFVVNEYFFYDLNSYQRGTIRFPLSSLKPGKHTFTCKAWDIYNNAGKGVVACLVIPPRTLEISSHGAFPVPFKDQLTVWIRQSLPGETLRVEWKIVDQIGRKIVQGEEVFEMSKAKIEIVRWNGQGINGNLVGPGLYFYEVLIKTEDGMEKAVGGKFIKAQ